MSVDLAVLLYGSCARGDNDTLSDVDVLVVGPALPNEGDLAAVCMGLCGPVYASHYTWPEVEKMAQYGSLFLHHIAAEAKPVKYDGEGEARLSDLLRGMGPYECAERDLAGFRTTVGDVKEGLRLGLPREFELSVLGGVARHASVLACYASGFPTYGRCSIVNAASLLEVPWASEDLELAHRFRLVEAGRCEAPAVPTHAATLRIVRTAETFLDHLERTINADA